MLFQLSYRRLSTSVWAGCRRNEQEVSKRTLHISLRETEYTRLHLIAANLDAGRVQEKPPL
jgi:hypothetical protein